MGQYNKVEKVKFRNEHDMIEVEGDGFYKMCIPIDQNNRHYQEIKKLEREGKIQITDKKLDQEVQPIGE